MARVRVHRYAERMFFEHAREALATGSKNDGWSEFLRVIDACVADSHNYMIISNNNHTIILITHFKVLMSS